MQVFVFFPEEEKVGVKTIKTFAERMRNEGVNRAVMVTQVNMTPFARQCLQEMAPKYYIEVVSHPCYSHCAYLPHCLVMIAATRCILGCLVRTSCCHHTGP